MILTVIALTLAVPTVIFAIECLAGLRPLQSPVISDRPAFVVLMPAHNETEGIVGTISRLKLELGPADRLLVVADNCTDDTAAKARSAGAEVVERHDPERRGKGFALDYGRNILASSPPSAVIVIDADCWVEPGSLARLASLCRNRHAAVQANYLLCIEKGTDPLVDISNFAFQVKNLLRQRGLARLGSSALLQGTGMAFPWEVLRDLPLASNALAEDLQAGITLLLDGNEVIWTDIATVWSSPASRQATITQRTRWEHGFLTCAYNGVPRLLAASWQQRRIGLFLLALDLMVPPLALLISILTIAGLITAIAYFANGEWLPLSIIVGALGMVCVTVLTAWFTNGRSTLRFATLLRAPLYVLWKIPIYLNLISNREQRWIRTERGNSKAEQ